MKMTAHLFQVDRDGEPATDNPQAYYNRGCCIRRSDSTICSRRFHHHVRPMALQAEPLVARSLSYLALNRNKEAATDLDEAVQLTPDSVQAWNSRGLAYERLGDNNKAASSYAKALALRKDDEARALASPASVAAPASATIRSSVQR